MTTRTTTRTTTTTTRTRTRTRRRTRSNNNNDDNEDAARSMSCPQVQMKSPSLFPSPDPYRHRRCAKLYNMIFKRTNFCIWNLWKLLKHQRNFIGPTVGTGTRLQVDLRLSSLLIAWLQGRSGRCQCRVSPSLASHLRMSRGLADLDKIRVMWEKHDVQSFDAPWLRRINMKDPPRIQHWWCHGWMLAIPQTKA